MLHLQKGPERLFAALERSRPEHHQRPRGEIWLDQTHDKLRISHRKAGSRFHQLRGWFEWLNEYFLWSPIRWWMRRVLLSSLEGLLTRLRHRSGEEMLGRAWKDHPWDNGAEEAAFKIEQTSWSVMIGPIRIWLNFWTSLGGICSAIAGIAQPRGWCSMDNKKLFWNQDDRKIVLSSLPKNSQRWACPSKIALLLFYYHNSTISDGWNSK
jgi:hypothetical protein